MKKMFVMFIVTLLVVGFITKPADASGINRSIAADVISSEIKECYEETEGVTADTISVQQDCGKIYTIYVAGHDEYGNTEYVTVKFNIDTGEPVSIEAWGFMDGKWYYESETGEDLDGCYLAIPLYE